jgi:hypothetical protein
LQATAQVTSERFEDQYPEAASILIDIYSSNPKHLIVIEEGGELRLHQCYFAEKWHIE